ncbi:hypothetical protein CRE_06837 [Caenorhabditis remanei]|uniref:Uncharacterized protein n=1 Tax=Caenorhabditis remanei TaxID=31234 RepID=E3MZH7_CAERE|nr:hypothetical protein CRE_06837 [Caenorhabditis remanei]
MASSSSTEDGVEEIARRWMEMEEIVPIATADRLLERPCKLKHVCWKFNDTCNEIWIDGRLGVTFTPNQPTESGGTQTKVHYDVDIDKSESKTAFYAFDLAELARWHLAWLTDPNVWIDSATIDMEFDQKWMVEKRKLQVKEVNITVQTNYPSIHGWLAHMTKDVESFIYRGNGIMDANRFLQLPFAAKLRKLMLIYESTFDDRLLPQLGAQHLQISTDFATDAGVNELLHRWNDQNYPIRSQFVIYVQIKSSANVVKNLKVMQSQHQDSGVSEFLIEMNNPNTRMRVITRPSSVICTIFAIDNSQAPPPFVTPTIDDKQN